MMDVVWIIQGNLRNKRTVNAIRDSLEHFSYAYKELSLVPFAKNIPLESIGSLPDKVIFWGAGFVPRACNYLYRPGIWYNNELFRWSIFSEMWADLMLTKNAEVITFADAMARLTSVQVFMRPDEDSKEFEGGIYSVDNKPDLLTKNEEINVVYGDVRSVLHEWRFFIVDQVIVASSSYRLNGKPSQMGAIHKEAIDLVNRAVKQWTPADVFCLDIGFDGHQYGIIEANCFNASRHYGANTQAIVRAVTEFTR